MIPDKSPHVTKAGVKPYEGQDEESNGSRMMPRFLFWDWVNDGVIFLRLGRLRSSLVGSLQGNVLIFKLFPHTPYPISHQPYHFYLKICQFQHFSLTYRLSLYQSRLTQEKRNHLKQRRFDAWNLSHKWCEKWKAKWDGETTQRWTTLGSCCHVQARRTKEGLLSPRRSWIHGDVIWQMPEPLQRQRQRRKEMTWLSPIPTNSA